MKQQISRVIFVILIILITINAFSQSMGQSHKTLLGVKFYPVSVSFKHFINNNIGIERSGYSWNDRYKNRYNNINNGFYFRIDRVLGLDYYFNQGITNLSFGWPPSLGFVSEGRNGFNDAWVGFASRSAY